MFKNSHCDLALGPRMPKLEFVQDIVILNIYMIQNQNWSINKGARMMTKFFFSKNSHCDLDLNFITLKRKLIRGIVISNTCVKLYRNRVINEVARVMTLGEHTYEHTYVREKHHIPSTTSLCEGIINVTEYDNRTTYSILVFRTKLKKEKT